MSLEGNLGRALDRRNFLRRVVAAGAVAATAPAISTASVAYAQAVSDNGGGGGGGGGTGGPVGGSSTSYATAVAASVPYLWWRLEETSGTVAQDATVNDKDGTISGSPTLGVTGITTESKAVSFVDNTGGMTITSPAYGADDEPFVYSIELWFKTVSGSGSLLYLTDGANFDRSLWLTDGKLQFYNYTGPNLESTATYNDGQWHHVVGTLTAVPPTTVIPAAGGPAVLYVDGAPVASSSEVLTYDYAVPAHWQSGSGQFGTFTGLLDEVAVYHRTLSAAEVAGHYNAAKAVSP